MNWKQRPLSEIADLSLGKMLDQNKNRGELYPYLANVNVRWGEFDLTELRKMRFEEREFERYGLKDGDIIMCEGGEPGRCALWREQLPNMMIQKALHRIRPRVPLDSGFLFYALMNKGRNHEFDGLFTGSTIKHLPSEKLALVEVSYPPLNIQRKIAAVLSAYDDLIQNNTRRIQILEEMARALYREWCVEFRFPGHKDVPMVETGIGMVPKTWDVIRFDEALVLQRGFDLPTHQRGKGNIPIYASTGITGFHSVAKVKGPGVVTGRSGSLGSVMYSTTDFWPLNTSLWVKEYKRVSPLVAFYLLSTLDLGDYNSGAAVPTLNRNDVHKRPIAIPPSEIVKAFDAVAEPIRLQVTVLQQKNNNLRRTRDLLLPKLVSGEVDVSDLAIATGEAIA